jgi:hypothetical protein
MNRREALGLGAIALGAGAIGAERRAGATGRGPGSGARPTTVRDRLWLWGHPAGSHNGQYGLPGESTITPTEAAAYMGLRNLLMVRYGSRPEPPFTAEAEALRGLDRVVWSVEGGGGFDVEAALALRDRLPNLCGLIMDDYFGRVGPPAPPMWLAANSPVFPVTLTLRFAEPVAPTHVELTQSTWGTGDYRSAEFAVEGASEDGDWRLLGKGTLPNEAGAKVSIALPGEPLRGLRVRVLSSHDTKGAFSCGLTRVRLLGDDHEIPLANAEAEASSEYPDHPAANVLHEAPAEAPEGPFSLSAVKELRRKLDASRPPLDLWVVLYTGEFGLPFLQEHLALCDVVTMWTWQAADLALLGGSFARFGKLVGERRKVLGLYLWDYGAGRPMSVDAMATQCELGLTWLKQGPIEGMIFLASCICDLGLEAVEWTRRWTRGVGRETL